MSVNTINNVNQQRKTVDNEAPNVIVSGVVGTDVVFAYNYPPPTGQTTEYAQYDDAWQYFNIWKPLFDSMKGKKIVTPVLEDFFTMQDKNAFGNFSRFTDLDGNHVDNFNPPPVGGYIIDHYTGLGWYVGIINYDNSYFWENGLLQAANFVDSRGFSGYYNPNTKIIWDMIPEDPKNGNTWSLRYLFGEITLGNNSQSWLSTTNHASNTSAFTVRHRNNHSGSASWRQEDKSTVQKGILAYRIHYKPQF